MIGEIEGKRPAATAIEVWFQDGAEGPPCPCQSEGHADPPLAASRQPSTGGARPSVQVGLPVRGRLPRPRSRRRRRPVAGLVRGHEAVAPGAHAAVLIDGAGYHIAGDLTIPDNITL